MIDFRKLESLAHNIEQMNHKVSGAMDVLVDTLASVKRAAELHELAAAEMLKYYSSLNQIDKPPGE